jgi:hypothetical protein
MWAANQPAPLIAITGDRQGGGAARTAGFVSKVTAARFFWMDARVLVATSNKLHIFRCAGVVRSFWCEGANYCWLCCKQLYSGWQASDWVHAVLVIAG